MRYEELIGWAFERFLYSDFDQDAYIYADDDKGDINVHLIGLNIKIQGQHFTCTRLMTKKCNLDIKKRLNTITNMLREQIEFSSHYCSSFTS